MLLDITSAAVGFAVGLMFRDAIEAWAKAIFAAFKSKVAQVEAATKADLASLEEKFTNAQPVAPPTTLPPVASPPTTPTSGA